MLAFAIVAAAAVGVLTAIVIASPFLPLDAAIQRDIQATDLGPLTLAFPALTWLGGPGGVIMQAVVFVLVIAFNRHAWRLLLAGLAGGFWYVTIVNLVNRPRPLASQILRVTEHPGSTSFPSGHLIFITISVAVLMLCLGHRYLPRWALPIGWALVGAVVLAVGLDRISAGVHWPSDVLAGVLIATSWLALVVSVRWISDSALTTTPKVLIPARVNPVS
ncbi:MAG TPA: phosphatase PAP2 family protein [Candidatus Dormibacteraeota bacterium]|nr:phosphatase PAP2 family protein [Candidatus Dormibacteraeota bacterium]